MSTILRVRINTRKIKKDIGEITKGYTAILKTIAFAGEGDVVVSKRKKIKGSKQKGRMLHGKAIANILRSKGRDPFGYSQEVHDQVDDYVNRGVTRSIDEAWESGSPTENRMKTMLKAAAQIYADWARKNIKSGGLGKKKVVGKRKSFIKRYQTFIRKGVVPSRFGVPPHYGIYTGQFVDGIRAVWKLGRRA